jgi:hypothetical protein
MKHVYWYEANIALSPQMLSSVADNLPSCAGMKSFIIFFYKCMKVTFIHKGGWVKKEIFKNLVMKC